MTISEKRENPPEFRERVCSFALVDAVEDAEGLADCEEEEDEVDIGSTTRSGSYKKGHDRQYNKTQIQ